MSNQVFEPPFGHPQDTQQQHLHQPTHHEVGPLNATVAASSSDAAPPHTQVFLFLSIAAGRSAVYFSI